MKLVIPVSQSDVHLLPLFTDALVKLGHVGQHSMLLVPTPTVQEAAQEHANKLRTICDNVQVVATPADFQGGWPAGPNNHWYWTVSYLDSIKLREPWLWLEVDAVPLKPRWATLLQEAYFAADKSFFGYVKPVKFISQADSSVYNKPGEDFLLGVAIYPPGISGDEHIKPLFNNLGRRVPLAIKEPFDLYLRWVMKKRGVHSTTLITDLWRTCNYRHQGARIVCDPVAEEKHAKGGVVPVDALLVHGCRDGSLHRLIIGAEAEKPAPSLEKVSPAPASPPTPEEVLAYISTNKVRLREVQEKFNIKDVPTAIRLIQAAGYVVGNAAWVMKKGEKA